VRQDAATVSVLTATCTHQQCTITGFQNNVFQCPCHGSQFNATGGVIRGPATQSLRRYNATVSGDVISITA
jgi:cytochrome b6-f complex iron-sulfur subunit